MACRPRPCLAPPEKLPVARHPCRRLRTGWTVASVWGCSRASMLPTPSDSKPGSSQSLPCLSHGAPAQCSTTQLRQMSAPVLYAVFLRVTIAVRVAFTDVSCILCVCTLCPHTLFGTIYVFGCRQYTYQCTMMRSSFLFKHLDDIWLKLSRDD
jgi:hypothetical protein